MNKDLVIGIDSSTSATKAIAWDRNGDFVAEARVSIALSNPLPGYFEQDPNEWWGSTSVALKELMQQIDPDRVAAVSISNQRETFGLFRSNGEPVMPGLVWLDERAIKQQHSFSKEFGSARIGAISGKPVDVVVPIYRMIWIKEEEPEIFSQADHYADVHCYLNYCLTGKWTTSTASADPSGMLDMVTKTWSEDILSAAGIPISLMPELVEPGSLVGYVSKDAENLCGLPAGTPVIAGGGDGQCAACGVGTVEPSTAYMNLGTALVAGVYSPDFEHNQAFRTEIAVSDSGYIYETVLKSGTFLIDWVTRELAGVSPQERPAYLDQLEKEASKSPIGAGGLIVLPFWQGSMTPHWDSDARGIIAGLSGSTRRGDVYRALLEGLALDQAYALEKAMSATGGTISHVVAIGGGSASSLFLEIIADALNLPVLKSGVTEASSLGAAMSAAYGIGWYDSLGSASSSMSQRDLVATNPNPKRAARYAELRKIYDDLWPTMAAWNKRLRSFAIDDNNLPKT